MHLSLQDGWTAAYDSGHMGCVQMMLLERVAEVNVQNRVSGVIIHYVHTMQHVPMYISRMIDG